MDILFESEKQKEATERVLAAVRVKNINKEIDDYLNEMLTYAKNIDTILERNDLKARYYDRVSVVDEMTTIILDDDLCDIDFRIKEVVEDLIKRINTRINLVKNNDDLIRELETTYDLASNDFDEDVETAQLEPKNFVD